MPNTLIEMLDAKTIHARLHMPDTFLKFITRSELKKLGAEDSAEAASDAPLSFVPKESDFIYPTFRAISKAYLGKFGYYMDFSKADVLEQSVPLLNGVGIYADHNDDPMRVLGAVDQAIWNTEGKAPGINVVMKIDAAANPRIARALLMDPPALKSCSIAPFMQMSRSHPDLDGWTFYDLLGLEVEGQIVRFIVDKIDLYKELSIVSRGGDLEANKQVGDAAESFRLKMRDRHVGEKKTAVSIPAAHLRMVDGREGSHVSVTLSQPTEEKMNKALLKLLGLTDESPSQDAIDAAILTLTETNASLKTKAGDLEGQIAKLKAEKDALALRAADGDKYLADVRADAVRLATLVAQNGKLNDTVKKLISNASLTEALDVRKDYQGQVTVAFPLKCQACGKQQVERRSSIEEPVTSNKTPEKAGKDFSGFTFQ
jgi:hypothetical protein